MSARAFTQESNVYAAHTMPTRTQTEAAFTHHPQRKKESPTDTFLDGTAAIYTARADTVPADSLSRQRRSLP